MLSRPSMLTPACSLAAHRRTPPLALLPHSAAHSHTLSRRIPLHTPAHSHTLLHALSLIHAHCLTCARSSLHTAAHRHVLMRTYQWENDKSGGFKTIDKINWFINSYTTSLPLRHVFCYLNIRWNSLFTKLRGRRHGSYSMEWAAIIMIGSNHLVWLALHSMTSSPHQIRFMWAGHGSLKGKRIGNTYVIYM